MSKPLLPSMPPPKPKPPRTAPAHVGGNEPKQDQEPIRARVVPVQEVPELRVVPAPPDLEPGWEREPEPWRRQLPAVVPKIRLTPFNKIRFEVGTTEWQIKKLLPTTGIGLAWGPSQTYKSFWLLDLALHVALGRTYRGRRVRQGAVVYCAFEGGVGVSKRVEAFRKHHGLKPDLAIPFHLQSLRLALVEHAADLIEAIRADKVKPSLIVLDTLNRSMTGSESKDADMGAYLAAADALREAFNCFVMIVHHSGWDTSHSRGHTSLPFGVDVEIGVTRPADLTCVAEIRKMKDEETGDKITSRLQRVEIARDEDNEPVTSLVVLEAEPVPEAKRAVKLSRNEQTMFGILHAAKRLLTAEWNERAKEAGIGEKRKADLYDIRERLKAKGLVTQLGEQWSVKHESE
jgi:hypothetical protein